MANRQTISKQRKAPAEAKGQEPNTTAQPLINRLFGIDSRSLAVFRIVIGILLLSDLALRARDLGAMYTDGGMFPRSLICYHFTTIWNWSFHFGSGVVGVQAALFILAAVFALALAIGFETRLATIASWVMLVSLDHRVPPILSGADVLMRMLLFWGMWLPLGRSWSIDNWLVKRRGNIPQPPHATVLSVASAAVMLQMAMMYFCSAIYKSNATWFRGEAVAGSLAYNFYATQFGIYMRQFPGILKVLTWSTLALEYIGPVLLFVPKGTARLRLLVILALAAMHLCISACMQVDFFSPVSIAGLTFFIPTEFWESKALKRFISGGSGSRVPAITPARPKGWSYYVSQGSCLVLLLYVVGININGFPNHPLTEKPLSGEGFLWTGFDLSQKWSMFDDIPSKNGWYVARARLKDGSEVDLLRSGAAIGWDKPRFPAGVFPNFRWRKLFREMTYADELGYQVFRLPVSKYLCQEWDDRHIPEKQISEFDLIYCNEIDPKLTKTAGESLVVKERFVHLDFANPEQNQVVLQ